MRSELKEVLKYLAALDVKIQALNEQVRQLREDIAEMMRTEAAIRTRVDDIESVLEERNRELEALITVSRGIYDTIKKWIDEKISGKKRRRWLW